MYLFNVFPLSYKDFLFNATISYQLKGKSTCFVVLQCKLSFNLFDDILVNNL